MTTPVSSFASHHCDTLAYPNPYTTSLSILLVLGIFVSYIPQHYKIIKCGTSEGLSPWWVLLGGLSSIAAMGNILTLPASREDMMCCREISGGACASALLGVVQIGVQWGCFMFVVMLYLIFFPGTSDHELAASSSSLRSVPPPSRRNAHSLGFRLAASYPVLGEHAWVHRGRAFRDPILAADMVPGAFVFAFSLWNRVGWEGWSTWLMFVVTGCLQSVLLCLAMSYYLARRRLAKEVDDRNDYPRLDDVDGTAEPAMIRQGVESAPATIPPEVGAAPATSQREARRFLSEAELYAATPPEIDSDRSSSSGNDNESGTAQGQGTRPAQEKRFTAPARGDKWISTSATFTKKKDR
ncbi:hypothetical protein KC327_g65 [Hortaea werneckii]|nr:hypothetical protein KC327_g65 [Hortaea werneckii]